MTTQPLTRLATTLTVLAFAVAATAQQPGAPTAPASTRAAAPPAATQPITSVGGRIGTLLRQWQAQGAAAGNVGDYYDNRDRGHSELNLQPYPQLQKVRYAEEALKARADWAAQRQVLPVVVFGNSSTSATVTSGGSNIRAYYANPRGLVLLYQQYTHNNLYIYPEHLDHDPGHNGRGGYGDLYPANTPYLIASQGSSGSDQPFMRAIPFTLAAFRPEVKKRLIESGLLMPTVQMILRSTSKRLGPAATTAPATAGDPKRDTSRLGTPPAVDAAYLGGRAHPTAFEGGWVDDVKMIEMAHGITADRIPPMVGLRVVKEDVPGERLADTPCVVGWVFRDTRRGRTVTLSADASYDLNQRPLTYHWALLRGDPHRVRIRRLDEAGKSAEISVDWQVRRPVEPGSALESNRVDVGLFVHNGAYFSAPGFVTWFFPDDQARTYAADGRPLEIACGLGETAPAAANWVGLLDLLAADSPRGRLVRAAMPAQVEAIVAAGQDYRKAQAEVEAAQQKVKQAEDVRRSATDGVKKSQATTASAPAGDAASQAATALATATQASGKADADLGAARKALDAATRAAAAVLDRKLLGDGRTMRQVVEAGLRALIERPDFYTANAAVLDALLASADAGRKANVAKARKRLVGFGLLDEAEGRFTLRPILANSAPGFRGGNEPASASAPVASAPADKFTLFERSLLAQFHGQLLAELVCPGAVACPFTRNYVDPRVSRPENYRDVYQYDAAGACTGRTRYDGEKGMSSSLPPGAM